MIRPLAMLLPAAVLLVSAAAAAMETLSYGPGASQALDVYRAPGAGPHRLVVMVHGGGWTSGQKGSGRVAARLLNPLGYTVASIEYRMLPETDGRGEAEDVAHAVGYLLKNATGLSIDPSGFALMGHSAGGHLVALLGTDGAYLADAGVKPSALKAVIALDGVFDLTRFLLRYRAYPAARLFGPTPRDWDHFSPIALVPTMMMHPHFCIMHEDTNTRFAEQADAFVKALQAHGENAVEGVARGLNHGQVYGELATAGQPMGAFVENCLANAGLPPG
jgi:acetyl esterase/lipase